MVVALDITISVLTKYVNYVEIVKNFSFLENGSYFSKLVVFIK